MRRCAPVVLALTLATAAGCAENAILEVELDVPAQPSTEPPLYAFVQIRDEGWRFEEGWAAAARDWEGVALGPDRQVLDYSAIAGEDALPSLHVKVRFCLDPACSRHDEEMDPALWYRLETPFYSSKRTYWRASVPSIPVDVPTAPRVVDRCEIGGCFDVPPDTTSYCRSDGTHFCE